MINRIIIYSAPDGDAKTASELAARIGASFTSSDPDAEECDIYLRFDGKGVSLCGKGMRLYADLTRMIPRIRRENLNSEFLVRAAKPASFGDAPTALDATAGLGEDSLLLAVAGFDVTMCERDPVIAALLRDSLMRAADVPELSDAVSRMKLIECDSVGYMRGIDVPPDVILLDPMFPERKKSGSVKKKLKLIQMLEGPCCDEELLFSAAYDLGPKKLLIKRPAKGPYLSGKKPDYSITGDSVRYDCFARRTDAKR